MNNMYQDRLRISAVCALSLAVSLPIAIISLSKLTLVLAFFWLLVVSHDMRRSINRKPLLAHGLIYLAMVAFSVSVWWSTANGSAVSKSVAQHGNLLIIPLVYFMIRTRGEAELAMRIFLAGQLLLLLGSWALYLHFPMSRGHGGFGGANGDYAVFSSYLDQSIMTAVFGALTWHFRELLPSPLRTAQVAAVITLCTCAVFGIFVGRTSYLVALALATLAIYWALPKRWRIGAMVAPVLLAGLVSALAPMAVERAELVRTEVLMHLNSDGSHNDASSSGIRMNFWKTALKAIEKNVWIGHGAGSWGQQYDALQPDAQSPGYVPTVGNPHQEYLLWGVELGIPGIALLIAIFSASWRLSIGFGRPAAQASQSVLVAIMIACLVNCSLTDALIGDYLCLALALSICLGMKPLEPVTTGNE